jgi:putative SOS response-associated peptidase YedK
MIRRNILSKEEKNDQESSDNANVRYTKLKSSDSFTDVQVSGKSLVLTDLT